MPRRLVALLAIATGLVVANMYYVQPLLNLIGADFGLSDAMAGLLVTFAQLGYVLGLALIVPLGDLLERRRFITTQLIGVAVAAAVCAAAPSYAVLAAALAALGTLSVITHVVIPLASTLAAPEERGQVVGTVMSGLLIGILAARTLSGLLAELGGWRLVYGLAAVAMVVLSVVLRRALPSSPPTERLPYPALLRSVLTLIAAEPVLRQRMALGALSMASFSALWTSLAFLLGGAPYHYSEGVIGLFGLAGLAGALVAPMAGRWADRGHGRLVMTLCQLTVLVSWGVLALGRTSLLALVAGIVLIDLGIQATQISNQSRIYALRHDARGRVTTAYMVSYFVGGVAGSGVSAAVYGAGGWHATCLVGAAVSTAALVVWTATRRVDRVDADSATGAAT